MFDKKVLLYNEKNHNNDGNTLFWFCFVYKSPPDYSSADRTAHGACTVLSAPIRGVKNQVEKTFFFFPVKKLAFSITL